MIRGDAHLGDASTFGEITRAGNHAIPLPSCCCVMSEALYRTQTYLLDFCSRRLVSSLFQAAIAIAQRCRAFRTGTRWAFEHVYLLIAWPPAPSRAWLAGFLAGIFDAEGSFSIGVLRISNTDPQIIDWFSRALREFGFRFAIEEPPIGQRNKPIKVVRLVGGLPEHLRFFHLLDPAISRKLNIEGRAVKSEAPLQIISIEPVGTMRALRHHDRNGRFHRQWRGESQLLRAPESRLHGVVGGSGFRDAIVLQEGCRQGVGGRAGEARLCLQADHSRRQHRSVSADRAARCG